MIEPLIGSAPETCGKKFFGWQLDMHCKFVQGLTALERNHVRLFFFTDFIPKITRGLLTVAEMDNGSEQQYKQAIERATPGGSWL